MRKIQELGRFARILVTDPVAWMVKETHFDLWVSWDSLQLLPVYRVAQENCVLFYVTQPAHVHLAQKLIEKWTFQPKGLITVRMEDGHVMPCWVATKGVDTPLPFELQTDKPYRYSQLFQGGEGVALFTRHVTNSWAWWEPGNIKSLVDLWDYPFRPSGLDVDAEAATMISQIKDHFMAVNRLYWEIGDLINKLGKMNVPQRQVSLLLARTGVSFSWRWLWEIAKTAERTPEQIRDYSQSWSLNRKNPPSKRVEKTSVAAVSRAMNAKKAREARLAKLAAEKAEIPVEPEDPNKSPKKIRRGASAIAAQPRQSTPLIKREQKPKKDESEVEQGG